MLRYLDFQDKFIIHTDSSDIHLGATISQKGSPIAIFSKVLSKAQSNYTTTDKELLSIVEMLKELCTISCQQIIEVHTNNKNLTYQGTQHSQCVLRHRLLLEEYGVKSKYIPGNKMWPLIPYPDYQSNRLQYKTYQKKTMQLMKILNALLILKSYRRSNKRSTSQGKKSP